MSGIARKERCEECSSLSNLPTADTSRQGDMRHQRQTLRLCDSVLEITYGVVHVRGAETGMALLRLCLRGTTEAVRYRVVKSHIGRLVQSWSDGKCTDICGEDLSCYINNRHQRIEA